MSVHTMNFLNCTKKNFIELLRVAQIVFASKKRRESPQRFFDLENGDIYEIGHCPKKESKSIHLLLLYHKTKNLQLFAHKIKDILKIGR